MSKKIACLLSLLATLIISGCTKVPAGGPQLADQREIADLAQGIRALGDGIDPEEADRAARVALQYSYQLAQEYQITDPPLIHNTKVNLGLRPRGLCYHWAEDMEARLQQENFRTFTLHRAIANSNSPFRIEHSTVIVSRRGDIHTEGMVLDPWRYGGVLFWSPTLADTKYKWLPQAEVFKERRRRKQAQERQSARI